MIFGGQTDQPTDRQTDLSIKAPSRSLKIVKKKFKVEKNDLGSLLPEVLVLVNFVNEDP